MRRKDILDAIPQLHDLQADQARQETGAARVELLDRHLCGNCAAARLVPAETLLTSSLF
jgi:hypothetical protein